MLIFALACASDPLDRPEARFDLSEGSSLFDAPWPHDARRHPDGTLDLASFPNPFEFQLLDTYKEIGETLQGFSNNGGIYLPLVDDQLDLTLLPTPAESLQPDSTLILVDIDPRSPHRGERIPLQWRYFSDVTSYVAAPMLAAAPEFGFPLRPATTYALIATADIVAPSESFESTLQTPLYRDLRTWLPLLGLTDDDVGVATVFTTQDPLGEMATIAKFVRNHVDPPDLDLNLELMDELGVHTAWRTHYPSPVFTRGERPYSLEGGGFEFDDDGVPIIQSWDDMRLSVCTPTDLSGPPTGGWPIVIYQHGTGGDYDGYCNSNGLLEVGRRLGAEGFVGFGLDQPLHGTRSDGTAASDLEHFNIVNPEGGRTNFRQGGVDALYLASSLKRGGTHVLTTPDGTRLPVNGDHVYFMGHSQGGQTGTLALPFMGPDIEGAIISGAGGVLAITIVDRTDPLDFAELVRGLLGFEETEPVVELHPVITFIQLLVEVTDPANYAPYWYSEQGWWEQRPTPVLLTSGTRDAATPYRSANAMAVAARMPPLHPHASATDAFALRGLRPQHGPLLHNVEAYDGSEVTSAISQWTDGSHFVIFREDRAATMYQRFLRTGVDEGMPTIYLDPPAQ